MENQLPTYKPTEQDLIDKEFSTMKDKYYSRKHNGTSCKDVLQYLVDTYPTKKWHFSYELINKTTSKGGFLSHRSPARAGELVGLGLVEQRNIGRFATYRVKRENREEVLKYLNA
jgi:predicted transcriptional regulator with HTH domain